MSESDHAPQSVPFKERLGTNVKPNPRPHEQGHFDGPEDVVRSLAAQLPRRDEASADVNKSTDRPNVRAKNMQYPKKWPRTDRRDVRWDDYNRNE